MPSFIRCHRVFNYSIFDAHYAYAGAFVAEMIRQQGLTRFKQFCQLIADRRSRERFLANEPQIVAAAFQMVYGTNLSDWEIAWKQELKQ